MNTNKLENLFNVFFATFYGTLTHWLEMAYHCHADALSQSGHEAVQYEMVRSARLTSAVEFRLAVRAMLDGVTPARVLASPFRSAAFLSELLAVREELAEEVTHVTTYTYPWRDEEGAVRYARTLHNVTRVGGWD